MTSSSYRLYGDFSQAVHFLSGAQEMSVAVLSVPMGIVKTDPTTTKTASLPVLLLSPFGLLFV